MQTIILVFQIIAAVSALLILVTIVYSRKQLNEVIATRESGYLSEKICEFYSADMSLIQAHVISDHEKNQLSLNAISYSRTASLSSYLRLMDFFNSLAALLELKAVNEDLLIEYFGSFAIYYWALLGPLANELRKQRRRPDLYTGFEKLANRSLCDDDRGKPFSAFNPIERIRQLHQEREETKDEGSHT